MTATEMSSMGKNPGIEPGIPRVENGPPDSFPAFLLRAEELIQAENWPLNNISLNHFFRGYANILDINLSGVELLRTAVCRFGILRPNTVMLSIGARGKMSIDQYSAEHARAFGAILWILKSEEGEATVNWTDVVDEAKELGGQASFVNALYDPVLTQRKGKIKKMPTDSEEVPKSDISYYIRRKGERVSRFVPRMPFDFPYYEKGTIPELSQQALTGFSRFDSRIVELLSLVVPRSSDEVTVNRLQQIFLRQGISMGLEEVYVLVTALKFIKEVMTSGRITKDFDPSIDGITMQEIQQTLKTLARVMVTGGESRNTLEKVYQVAVQMARQHMPPPAPENQTNLRNKKVVR